jgi:probable F420-dependent oxidoreductase
MQFGFSPTQSKSTFEAMQRQARLAETLGFKMLWAHEHHSLGMMYPDPLMILAAMAGETKTIALGTNMLLLPIHHPVRVAQEAAMLDVLSHGRLRLGVANGYSRVDLRTFGVARSHRGARLAAGVELMRALWSGREVNQEGEDFHLEGFRLFPLPIQKPAPPIYIGGQADVAIERAARLGDGYLISTTETIDHVAQRVAVYRGALDKVGKPWSPPLLNRIVCTVQSRQEKREAEQFYSQALLSLYIAWGHENVTILSPAERAPEEVSRKHFIIGEASECIEQIEAYAKLGIGHIACLMNFGDPDLEFVERSMRLFGERVIPHFAA